MSWSINSEFGGSTATRPAFQIKYLEIHEAYTIFWGCSLLFSPSSPHTCSSTPACKMLSCSSATLAYVRWRRLTWRRTWGLPSRPSGWPSSSLWKPRTTPSTRRAKRSGSSRRYDAAMFVRLVCLFACLLVFSFVCLFSVCFLLRRLLRSTTSYYGGP